MSDLLIKIQRTPAADMSTMNEPAAEFRIESSFVEIEEAEAVARDTLRKLQGDSSKLTWDDERQLDRCFRTCLQCALSEMPSRFVLRNWIIDSVDGLEYFAQSKKYRLSGDVSWLEGGEECEYFELNVERGRFFRYSFRLLTKRKRQSLYVGRLNDHWLVKITGRLYTWTHPLG